METFQTFWAKSILSKILTKIEIFINFDITVILIKIFFENLDQEIQDVRNMRNCYVARTNSIYATSGDTIYWTPYQEIKKCTPHQYIQYICHIWKCYECVRNNICTTSENTMYCTPHQEIQEIRHIRKYRMYVISVNAIYCTPHQEIQEVRHIRIYRMYAI